MCTLCSLTDRLLFWVSRLYDEVQQALEAEGEILSLPAVCHLIWAMAEVGTVHVQVGVAHGPLGVV